MIARRPDQPDRPVQDRTPKNIFKRPLKLSPMRNVKEESSPEDCSCKKPIFFHHRDGTVTCVRCRRSVEEVASE